MTNDEWPSVSDADLLLVIPLHHHRSGYVSGEEPGSIGVAIPAYESVLKWIRSKINGSTGLGVKNNNLVSMRYKMPCDHKWLPRSAMTIESSDVRAPHNREEGQYGEFWPRLKNNYPVLCKNDFNPDDFEFPGGMTKGSKFIFSTNGNFRLETEYSNHRSLWRTVNVLPHHFGDIYNHIFRERPHMVSKLAAVE